MSSRCQRTVTFLTALATAAVIVLGVSFPAAAQSQGRIVGAVIDQTGGFVKGAVVVVRNERTGEERRTAVGDDGRYAFDLLKPSVYSIRVTKDGFAKLEYTGIPLAVGQELALDASLQPAGVSETVEV
ncbi:MAG: carboxypeptidase-like regulatory domain-containing protein, partial [Acidobacteria bacterium]|nr:carboxypeptidase-like regulatory domain-containing protein [Acidobacteriota bacterium]